MNETLVILAGLLSSALFMFSQLPMLYKAYKTKDLKSYSLTNLLLVLLGDLLYWVYLVAVPFGPIWLLHCFDTVCSILMLFFYLRHGFGPRIKLLALLKVPKRHQD